MEMRNGSKRQQPDHAWNKNQQVTNRSSMQPETPAPGGVLRLAHKQIYITNIYIQKWPLNKYIYTKMRRG